MEFLDLRARLNSEYERLHAVAIDLRAPVPSCPGWTLEQLVRHVAQVYLHKVACMQAGPVPGEPPPAGPDLTAEPALDLLARAYHELTDEFDARAPEEPTWTWFAPDQKVGFWIRRMAHETAIHRYDAELATGTTTPIVTDLALDGVDEALTVILAADGDLAGISETDLPSIELRIGARSFIVRPTLSGIAVDATGEAATTIEGVPSDLLLWLWRRAGPENLKVTGDPAGVATLSRLMQTATQ